MARLDMETLTKNAQGFGQDRLVELKLLQPGIIVGIWKVITSQAVMALLNYCSLPYSSWER